MERRSHVIYLLSASRCLSHMLIGTFCSQGCTRGHHSNEKPQEPLQPEVTSDKGDVKQHSAEEMIYQGPKSAEALQKERPRYSVLFHTPAHCSEYNIRFFLWSSLYQKLNHSSFWLLNKNRHWHVFQFHLSQLRWAKDKVAGEDRSLPGSDRGENEDHGGGEERDAGWANPVIDTAPDRLQHKHIDTSASVLYRFWSNIDNQHQSNVWKNESM